MVAGEPPAHPMLLYFKSGIRRYDRSPVRVSIRGGWEFQAVLRGAISLVVSASTHPPQKSCLWLSRPDFPHGWSAPHGSRADVIVFHFPYVPESLLGLLRTDQGFVGIPLSGAQAARIRVLGAQAARYWNHPRPGRILCFEHILQELSFLMFEQLMGDSTTTPIDLPARRAGKALAWYAGRLGANPSLEDVARATGISVAQLRRDFHATLAQGPKETFTEFRLKRAVEMIEDPELTMEEIAGRCGFSSASTFSRAFKNRFGRPPSAWEPTVPARPPAKQPGRMPQDLIP